MAVIADCRFCILAFAILLARRNPVLIAAARSVIGFPPGWILRQTRPSSLRRLEEAILKCTLTTLRSDDTREHLRRREACNMGCIIKSKSIRVTGCKRTRYVNTRDAACHLNVSFIIFHSAVLFSRKTLLSNCIYKHFINPLL